MILELFITTLFFLDLFGIVVVGFAFSSRPTKTFSHRNYSKISELLDLSSPSPPPREIIPLFSYDNSF